MNHTFLNQSSIQFLSAISDLREMSSNGIIPASMYKEVTEPCIIYDDNPSNDEGHGSKHQFLVLNKYSDDLSYSEKFIGADFVVRWDDNSESFMRTPTLFITFDLVDSFFVIKDGGVRLFSDQAEFDDFCKGLELSRGL